MPRFLQRFLAVLALLTLASCTLPGEPVAGIPDAAPWYSLDFSEMLHEGDAKPVALSFCAVAQCPKRLAIGMIAVTGKGAAQLESLLRNPARLAAEMKRRDREPARKSAAKAPGKPRVETVTTVAPLRDAPADGFTLAMARKDGKGRIKAAVLGWREGEKLYVVIAIGDDAGAVREVAIGAAERYMGMAGSH